MTLPRLVSPNVYLDARRPEWKACEQRGEVTYVPTYGAVAITNVLIAAQVK